MAAPALLSNWKAKTVAAAMSGLAAFAPAASAEEVTTVAAMNPELEELHEAALAAREYAENNYGVGILIHVGTEVAAQNGEQTLGNNLIAIMANPKLLNRIAVEKESGEVQSFLQANCPGLDPLAVENMEGVAAQYFLNYTDGPGTVISYHINHLIAGADNGTEIKKMTEAICAIPDAVEQLPIAKSIIVSSNEAAPAVNNN